MIDKPNISTEHNPKGSARNLSDTLDKQPEDKAPGTSAAAKKGERPDTNFAENGE